LHQVQRDVVAPVPTAKERAAAQENLDDQVKWAKEVQASLPNYRIPARKQVLSRMQFSADGELWIEREVTAGQPHEADIYDRRGQFVAIAEWTGLSMPNFLTTMRGRTLLTVARDSNDVQRVVRLRFK
jgi:hypothetical protein